MGCFKHVGECGIGQHKAQRPIEQITCSTPPANLGLPYCNFVVNGNKTISSGKFWINHILHFLPNNLFIGEDEGE